MSCPSGVPRCRLVPLGKSTSSDAFLHQLGGQKSQSMQESGVCGLPAGGATRCLKPCCSPPGMGTSLYLVTRNTSRGYCGGQARHVSRPIKARSSGSEVFASQCRSQAWWELVRARGVQDILTRSRDHVGCVGRGRAGVRGTRFGSCAPPSQKLLAASLSPALGPAALPSTLHASCDRATASDSLPSDYPWGSRLPVSILRSARAWLFSASSCNTTNIAVWNP